MTDIVERLRFDAARCEVDYSKGVAGNITEAADTIERMSVALTWYAKGGTNWDKGKRARAALTTSQRGTE